MPIYRYPAILSKQTKSEKPIVLFAPSAVEIAKWAGVPQKKSFAEGAETTGFQREENKKRLNSLSAFYSDPENIIQNTLLCGTRKTPETSIRFEPQNTEPAGSNSAQIGTLIIDTGGIEDLSLTTLCRLLADSIRDRLPAPPERNSLLETIQALAAEAGHDTSALDPREDSEIESDDESNVESALFEESHLKDFWEELDARAQVLESLGESAPEEEFLGFTKRDLLEQLKPAVLIDGQHRLLGALRSAENQLETPDIRTVIEDRVVAGEDPDHIYQELLSSFTRSLPVSLLLCEDTEEQVFQFVIVNQKATPIGRALLGTIVSTTLTEDEMSHVVGRLTSAGIEVEESRAITYIAKNPESPFFGLIDRGLSTDSREALQWNVAAALVSIFRNLKGGALFGQRNDYADAWRRRYLETSGIVSDFAEQGFESAYEYWSSTSGPWRDVFTLFFSKIRDEFSSTTEPSLHNYWGNPRNSNLFNKISLTILAADFFQFLVTTKKTIDDSSIVHRLMDDWLEDVNRSYFARDWELGGVKKDSVGIRNQWAELWAEYRKDPGQLPDKRNYRNPKRD